MWKLQREISNLDEHDRRYFAPSVALRCGRKCLNENVPSRFRPFGNHAQAQCMEHLVLRLHPPRRRRLRHLKSNPRQNVKAARDCESLLFGNDSRPALPERRDDLPIGGWRKYLDGRTANVNGAKHRPNQKRKCDDDVLPRVQCPLT